MHTIARPLVKQPQQHPQQRAPAITWTPEPEPVTFGRRRSIFEAETWPRTRLGELLFLPITRALALFAVAFRTAKIILGWL